MTDPTVIGMIIIMRIEWTCAVEPQNFYLFTLKETIDGGDAVPRRWSLMHARS